ncbi:MAG TPA: ATP-binding protein [Gemmatimonadaceae bacterium]
MAKRGNPQLDPLPPEDAAGARGLKRVFWLGTAGLASVALTVLAVHLWWANSHERLLTSGAVVRVAREIRWTIADREAVLSGALLANDTAAVTAALTSDPLLDSALDSLFALTAGDQLLVPQARAVGDAVDTWERSLQMARLAADSRTVVASSRVRLEQVREPLRQLIASSEERFESQRVHGRQMSLIGVALVLVQLALLAILLAMLRRRTVAQAAHIATQRQRLATKVDELSRTRAASHAVAREHERSRAALETVLASAPVGIAVLDVYGRVEQVNPVFAQFAGATAEAYTGRYLREIAPGPARVLDPLLAQVTASAHPVQDVEIEGARNEPGEKPRLWRVSVYPTRTASGTVDGAGIVAVDITPYRNMERQLLQAQKMEAVGRLAGSIAHDFNNLLTAISAFGQFAQEDVDPKSRAREDIGQIILAAERGAALTRRLMAFSQPQATSDDRVDDLARLLRELTGLLHRLVGEDIALNTHFAPDLWPVDADPAQIEQIVLNLVVNARDAMPSGGTIVIEAANTHLDAEHVSEYPGATPGPHVMIAVTDTGVGMDAETRARIFEPFFTTKPIGKGTGLGLATVQTIVNQLGGAIWVYSEPGRGSTFKVYFPRSVAGAGTRTPPSTATFADGLSSVSLLLVEDDPSVRRAVQRGLERYRCTVHVADNGRHALEVLERLGGNVDVVLTDLVMPEMGGFEFSRTIRARAPHIRLILMSGYAVESVQQQGLREAGAVFLEKPFTTDALVARIREAMESSNRPADEVIGN